MLFHEIGVYFLGSFPTPRPKVAGNLMHQENAYEARGQY
jgi:hypothetical protein